MSIIRNIIATAALGWAAIAAAQEPPPAPVSFSIEARSMKAALTEFGQQAGVQILFSKEAVETLRSGGVTGAHTPEAALQKLIARTDLQYEFVNARTVRVWRPQEKPAADAASVSAIHLARAEVQAGRVGEPLQAQAAPEPDTSGVPEILVKGARSSNADIRRTEDDVQPYVVLDAEDIERSMAPDLETFLRTRLPMNQSRGSENQKLTDGRGNQSSIDLRGLGANQTLVLVNGRRIPGVAGIQDVYQPDINGIPLSAIERIEILPSTAGGIYGGGATGGVVNIILKRDYSDMEITARYDGTFAGGGAERRLDAVAGFTLEEGKTSIMLTGSYRAGKPLYIGDRDFAARSRALQDRNDRAALVNGSFPLHGYTTNIRSVSGNDLVLKDGLVSLGSPIAHVPEGYAGPSVDGGAAFLQTAGRYELRTANDPVGAGFALLMAPAVRTLNVNVRREFGARLEGFLDAARYDSRSVRMGSWQTAFMGNVTLPAGPDNPFTEDVRLRVPLAGWEDTVRTRNRSLSDQITGGLILRLPRDWVAQAEYGWNRSSSITDMPESILNPDGANALVDGRLDPLSDVNRHPLDFSLLYAGELGSRGVTEYPVERDSATLRISGPLLNLPGGPLRLAALLERQEEQTTDRIYASYPGGAGSPLYYYIPPVGSKTGSGYMELNAPLISAGNARAGVRALDVRASWRRDITETTASQFFVTVPSPDGPFPDLPAPTNKITADQYTLGLRYVPVENLALRVSYGEGILPPGNNQLFEVGLGPDLLQWFGLVDPLRNAEPITDSTVQLLSLNGNLTLRPELSQSWSAGLVVTPAGVPGLRLSLDYTRIEKTDEIGSLDWQVLIDLGDRFPDSVVRNALTPGDAALGYTGGTIRELRIGMVNIAKSLVEALDVQADYAWDTRFGAFEASLMATVQPRLAQQPTPDAPMFNMVGYASGPLKWRANGGLRWSRGALDLGWNMQFHDAYRVYTSTASQSSRDALVLGQGSPLIPTQTYHDVYGRYRFNRMSGFAGGLLANAELQVSVQNVLNTSPPILASASNILLAGYATEGDPRLRRYSIAFSRRFGR